MAVSFSIISGAAYPEWLWAFQSFLGQPILHGCELFNHLWQPLLHGCELFNHFLDSLSCMAHCIAVSFSITSGAAYPEWL